MKLGPQISIRRVATMTACLLAGALSALLQPRIEAFTQPPVSAGRRGELVWMGTEGVAAYAYVDKRGIPRALRSWRDGSVGAEPPESAQFYLSDTAVRPSVASLGWSRIAHDWESDPRALVPLAEYSYGWPLRSMVVELVESHGRQNTVKVFAGEPLPRDASMKTRLRAWLGVPTVEGFMGGSPEAAMSRLSRLPSFAMIECPRVVPGRLVLGAFFANGLLFAALAWLVATAAYSAARPIWGVVLKYRESLRVRRGECGACGYPLAGRACCPECGALTSARVRD